METIALTGPWRIQSEDGRFELESPAPGSLFAALEASGHFGRGGINWRENNRECLEIADQAFSWSHSFSLSQAMLGDAESGDLVLEADGLDTLAEIRLNGEVLGNTANMHRRWRFSLAGLAKPGANTITIRFANALEHCRREQARRPLWHSYGDKPEIAFGGFNVIRKSHCSFGWDWGPIIPDLGIWRAIRLVRYANARLENVDIRQRHFSLDGQAQVELTISCPITFWQDNSYQGKPQRGNLGDKLKEAIGQITGTGGEIQAIGSLTLPDGASHEFAIDAQGHATVLIKRPQLWWPNGLGGQPLYQLSVRLYHGKRLIDRRDLSIGLRTLTVLRQPDAWGESFTICVNGRPIFAQGADYIPQDTCLARVTPERTEQLIRDAVAANFNCLRVWGGGVYPDDHFYDLCDRYGLVVWQDLMFACAIYDIRNPEFLDNVQAEVRDNLLRIRHHPCLALVCGNNEMEVALVEWGLPDIPETRTEYLLQYQHYFKRIAEEVCPDSFYWPASPSSGGDFDQPNAPDRGDCHFWEVWHGGKDFSEYSAHYFRFMSEFGFESLPSLKTINGFTLPEDRNLFSPVMEDHQRCVGGNAKIMDYICRNFRSPADFSATVYLSWLSQAESFRHGAQHWRRNRGRCMGSVYWQLNDNWPASSWSSIDGGGRWKALHYEAKRCYAPLVLSVAPATSASEANPAIQGNGHFTPQNPQVGIHLSNESLATATGRLEWRLLGMDGAIAQSGETAFSAAATADTLLATLDFRTIIQGRLAPRQYILSVRARLEDGRILNCCHNFVPFKQLDLAAAKLSCRISQAEPGNQFLIEISSDKPALFVEIDHPLFDLLLSDNFFFLDRPRQIIIEACRQAGSPVLPSLEEISDGISLRSLRNSYH